MSKEETQFKPGESGNPNGRPKGSAENSITGIIRANSGDQVTFKLKGEEHTMSKAEAMDFILTSKAIAGNLKAMEIYMDRHDGKSVQPQEHRFPKKADEMLDTINDIIGKPEKKSD